MQKTDGSDPDRRIYPDRDPKHCLKAYNNHTASEKTFRYLIPFPLFLFFLCFCTFQILLLFFTAGSVHCTVNKVSFFTLSLPVRQWHLDLCHVHPVSPLLRCLHPQLSQYAKFCRIRIFPWW